MSKSGESKKHPRNLHKEDMWVGKNAMLIK